MTLAPFVHALGRGPGRSRALEQKEAREAMALILSGQAAPEAVGAMLMLMRYRGETAEEIAGFVEAMRDRVSPWANLPVTLDWPSYASGRSRGLPLFLLAAKLAAEAGHKVLLHGWNSTQNPLADIRSQIGSVGISSVETPEAAKAALARDGIVYVPLEALDPDQMRVLQLRDVLGLRSPINTALRALNPARAKLAVQGVFHPPYRALQQDAAALLGDSTLLVLKGGGGEFERHPSKDTLLYGLDRGDAFERTASAMSD
ncbi:MAG: glycosyl transferase family protein, partial [Mangrovicoccus sp.]